jgi:UDP-glucuronate decarboxylase
LSAGRQGTTIEEDLEQVAKSLGKQREFDESVVLVTGCAGFVGFYLMHFLTRYAEAVGIRKVIGIDNLVLGRPLWLDELKTRYSDKLSLHSLDIGNQEIRKLRDVEKADFVIHMASIASPVFYRAHPIETIDGNVWGLRRLLDYFKDKTLRDFLFFSSSEVYGDPSPKDVPTDETYRGNVMAMGPRACYDESKRFGETLCYVFAEQYGLPITIVRPFNVYGPGMKLTDGRVPADFARSIVQNSDILIRSDGTPRRTFCYVSDALAGFLKALAFRKFDCFNIGIDKPEISITELARIYMEEGGIVFNYSGRVRYEKSHDEQYLTHSPSRRCPNIQKARTMLGYDPHIEVREGVNRFLRFLAEERGKKA